MRPINIRRARRADKAVRAFGVEDDDPETVLTDLLTNLMHWADWKSAVNFDDALRRARTHHQEEGGTRVSPDSQLDTCPHE